MSNICGVLSFFRLGLGRLWIFSTWHFPSRIHSSVFLRAVLSCLSHPLKAWSCIQSLGKPHLTWARREDFHPYLLKATVSSVLQIQTPSSFLDHVATVSRLWFLYWWMSLGTVSSTQFSLLYTLLSLSMSSLFNTIWTHSHLSSELQVYAPNCFFYLLCTHLKPTGWMPNGLPWLDKQQPAHPLQKPGVIWGPSPSPWLLSHQVSPPTVHFLCFSPSSLILPSCPHTSPEDSLPPQFIDITHWVLHLLPTFVLPGLCHLVNF